MGEIKCNIKKKTKKVEDMVTVTRFFACSSCPPPNDLRPVLWERITFNSMLLRKTRKPDYTLDKLFLLFFFLVLLSFLFVLVSITAIVLTDSFNCGTSENTESRYPSKCYE